MHLFWMACSTLVPHGGPALAWITFTLYYVFVHSLPHVTRLCTSPKRIVVTSLAALLPLLLLHGEDLVVNETMQKIVVAHVAVDETSRLL